MSEANADSSLTASAPSARRWLRPLIAVGGYGAILVLAFRAIDRDRFVQGFSRLGARDLLLVLAVALMHVTGRALRFHWLVLHAKAKNYRFLDGVRIFLIGLSASAVTPARAGDFIKVQLLKPFGVGYNVGIGLVMVERILDLLVITSSIVFTGAFLSEAAGAGWRGVALVLLLGLMVGVAAATVKRVRKPVLRAVVSLVGKVRPSADTHKLDEMLSGVFGVWDSVFDSPARLAKYWSYSAVVWSIEFLKLWLVLHLVGVAIDPSIALFVYPVSIVAGILTILPFSEGVVGVTGVALLASMASVDTASATVAVVVDRAASSLPPLVLWALFALVSGHRRKP